MKKILILTALIYGSQHLLAHPNEKGIQFFHGTWAEAKAKAKAENKNIFVDFYATWCGPCKWMSKEVFTDSTVGAAFANKVIAFKVNAETEEHELVASVNLEAYPTLALFDANGQLLLKSVGAMEASKLIEFIDANKGFEEKEKAYRANPHDIQKFSAYLDALSFKDKKQVATEVKIFLQQLPKESLKTVEAWNLISKNLEDVNSPIVSFVFENAAWYKANGEGFQDGLSWFINALMSKAADSAQREPMLKAQQLYLSARKNLKNLTKPEAYYTEAFEIVHALNTSDTLQYANRLLNLLEKYHAKDADALAANVQEILEVRPKDLKVKAKLLTLATRARQLKNTTFTTWVLAYAQQVCDTKAPGNYKKLLIDALIKAPNDKLKLTMGGTSLIFDESQKTVSALCLNFE